jgi:hypothetical protein
VSGEKVDKPFQWLILAIVVLVFASCVSGMRIVGEAKRDDARKAFISGVWAKTSPIIKYFNSTGQFPISVEETGVLAYQESETEIFDGRKFVKLSAEIEIIDGKIIISFSGVSKDTISTLIQEPVQKADSIDWVCNGTLENKYRTNVCK